MNISMTPTAEALVLDLIALGYDKPELIIEEALKAFHDQQLALRQTSSSMTEVDISEGFGALTEAEIIQENEQRWQTFQQTGKRFSHEQVVDWAASLGIE